MSEEMKLLLALLNHLKLEALCTGTKDGEPVKDMILCEDCFSGRSQEYDYTIRESKN